MKHAQVTERIISAYFKVYNTLGYGFLEKVYRNAMAIELRRQGMVVQCEAPIDVAYEGEIVGQYFADMLVERCVIVETKAVQVLGLDHHRQIENYLKATEIDVGLLMNFGPKPEWKRKIFETARQQPSLVANLESDTATRS